MSCDVTSPIATGHFVLPLGDDHELPIEWRDETGALLKLTAGETLEFVIHQGSPAGDIVLTLTSEDEEIEIGGAEDDFTLKVIFTPAHTEDLVIQTGVSYHYFLRILTPARQTLCKGRVYLDQA